VIVRQLVDYRHGKRWDDRMEAFTDEHMLRNFQEIADIAGYVSQLRFTGAVTQGDGASLEKAALTYKRSCRRCHGAQGEGNGAKAVPKLSGQRYEYLLRQMYDATDGRRPNFSAAHLKLLGRMDRDDFTGLADFLSRQR
jgi:cytochrome c553